MLHAIMTKLGKIVFTLVVLLLAGFAVTRMLGKKEGRLRTTPSPHLSSQEARDGGSDGGEVAAFDFIAPGKAPQLPSPRPYTPQDNTIAINLSEYAG